MNCCCNFFLISEYKGQFEGGKRHGQGTLYHPDGSVFQGLFVFGQVNGKGILTLPNGDKISGEFRQVSFFIAKSVPRMLDAFIRWVEHITSFHFNLG